MVAGVTNGMVMMIINDVAKDFNEINLRNMLLFSLCIGVFVFCRKYSEYFAQSGVQQAISNKHLKIIDKLRKSSLVHYEKIGKMSIITNITENSQIIYESTRLMVHSMTASMMLLFSFLYIAYLSLYAFGMCVVILGTGVFIYKHGQKDIIRLYHEFQEKDQLFFESLNHFLDGFKEIKISQKRSDDIYYNEFSRNIDDSLELKFQSEKKVVANMVFGQTMFFMLMASIVFVLPQIEEIESATMMSITAVVLFISGAIGLLIESIPMIIKANMALENLFKLEAILDKSGEIEQHSDEGQYVDFKEISLSDLNYDYVNAQGKAMFGIGPMNFTLKRGQITFIVGGNGSGKTTLLKNLAGMYYPKSGDLRIDGNDIPADSYDDYRSLFSMVLTDFHLFDKLYGLGKLDDKVVNVLLKKMQVDNKTRFKNGRFTNLDLSTGQRKRIAVIVALLEDKPVVVFDEVAADQDPEFRDFYYHEILPELKLANKTVLVVSHDDRYFDVADTLIKLEYGKVINITNKEEHASV
jgi:putative ATP-binding cassette transporter